MCTFQFQPYFKIIYYCSCSFYGAEFFAECFFKVRKIVIPLVSYMFLFLSAFSLCCINQKNVAVFLYCLHKILSIFMGTSRLKNTHFSLHHWSISSLVSYVWTDTCLIIIHESSILTLWQTYILFCVTSVNSWI